MSLLTSVSSPYFCPEWWFQHVCLTIVHGTCLDADSDEDCSSSELKSAGAIAYVGIHGPVHRRKHGHTMVDELQL